MCLYFHCVYIYIYTYILYNCPVILFSYYSPIIPPLLWYPVIIQLCSHCPPAILPISHVPLFSHYYPIIYYQFFLPFLCHYSPIIIQLFSHYYPIMLDNPFQQKVKADLLLVSTRSASSTKCSKRATICQLFNQSDKNMGISWDVLGRKQDH